MDNPHEMFASIDTEDASLQKACERLNRMVRDSKFRKQAVTQAESRLKELQDAEWESQEETFSITVKKEHLLQLKITLVFYSEILGIPEEDVISSLLVPGLQQEAYKLGLVRQAVMQTLSRPVPEREDLSIDAEDLVDSQE